MSHPSSEEMDLTPILNENSIESVRAMIQRKNGYLPYYSNNRAVQNVITDQDHFPYTRYFRGVPEQSRPIIAEREAGWRPIQNDCYKLTTQKIKTEPKYCWQNACSTVLPCKVVPEDNTIALINKECLVKYR